VALYTLPTPFLDISKESGQGALKITGGIFATRLVSGVLVCLKWMVALVFHLVVDRHYKLQRERLIRQHTQTNPRK
jgi:hypothetical protein